jgi:signal peptidase II
MKKENIKTRILVFVIIVLTCLMVDLVVKEIASTTLMGKEDVVVIPGFWSFHLTYNADIGFSLLRFTDSFLDQNLKRVLIVVLQLTGVGIAGFFNFSKKNYLHSWVKRLPLALVAAGGLGNASDRIIRGSVVDFILWHCGNFYWPVFNLADTFTVIGVCLLAVFIIFTKKAKKDPTVSSADHGNDLPPQI